MPDKIDEILFEVKKLSVKLYGENGFEGDIPEIKAGFKNHSKRIRIIELILAGAGVAGGGVLGVLQLFN